MIAICGREGAGKNTISNYLCKGIKKFSYVKISHTLYYVLEILFGWKYEELCNNEINNLKPDPIWGLTVMESINLITKLFKKHIDSNFEFPSSAVVPIPIINEGKYAEYSFADPLKMISSVIFTFPDIPQNELHNIFKGDLRELRDIREKIKTIEYDRCGSLTARKCLEYLGTDIFRDNFDSNIWILIFQRNMQKYYNYTVIIPDLRFENEKKAIENKGGKFIVIYKNENDLILTDDDKLNHQAKWKFLEFLPSIKNLIKIKNDGTLDDLYKKVDQIL